MRAIIYRRCSTEEQSDTRNGLNAQLDSCRACACRLGCKGEEIFSDEGVSGSASLEKRPGLLQALDALDRGDLLLVSRRDRLGRGDVILIAMIERAIARKGARLVSAHGEGTDSDEPQDILMRRMVDAFAEYERLIIKARTKAALKARKERGLKNGGAPRYGFFADSEGRLHPHDLEQQAIARMRELYRTGHKLLEICQTLSYEGYRPRNGKTQWHPMQVKRAIAA